MLLQSYRKPFILTPKPAFKRSNTSDDALRPHHLASRSPSSDPSGPNDRLRPSLDDQSPLRPQSPTDSMAPSSSPIRPLPSPPPLAVQTDWPGYLPKSRSSVDLISPHSDSSSSPDTPVDPIPELELRRRRQLDKAARILGETLPLDAVWNRATTPNLRIRAFPEPPPRRSTTDAPQSGQSPREVLTERSAVTTTTTTRRPGKIARRASISLATFALKLRGGGTHIRGSSQESQAQSMTSSSSSASSPSSPGERSTPSPQPTGITRRRSAVLTSPILFAFPGRTKSTHHARPISPPWPRSTPSPAPTLDFDPVGDSLNVDPDLILDIGPDLDLDDDDHESDLETPVVEHPTSTASRILQHKPSTSEILHPTPRIVPMPSHGHSPSEIVSPTTRRSPTAFGHSETPLADYSRPGTPFLRPETPFVDYMDFAPARPSTPFTDLRPTTPFADLDEPAHPSGASGHWLSPVVSRRERGQGWSGEWNQRDMNDVINKLRALK